MAHVGNALGLHRPLLQVGLERVVTGQTHRWGPLNCLADMVLLEPAEEVRVQGTIETIVVEA
eukprot:10954931-Lingulodinium_polyedra.AAC.1